MAGPITDARAGLVAVLGPVFGAGLVGRVYPYPPARPASTAPAVWIGDHAGGWEPPEMTATFEVWIVADGADHAAAATLDALVEAVYAAVAGSDDYFPDGWRPEPVDADATTVLPGYVFTVQCIIDISGWCQPAPPIPVTVPTQSVGA